ncbi:hypothetical protein FNV43_RR09628 [Rhamnella rubrinervis]|uniref:Uncharacterized protein n=1 Tax=Rhamnella rubrinervis TaxID=2594499 RepID=A0A8K0MJZ2_9ROSA|nr:hypothetical protein FNV43_RR09628 [Rhamnella rubrinervis]
MGGGPRTYPGGVSKWQWKRMQAKKAKQLLKARLCRERQLYEMRKRAELKAAVSELERPWEVVEKAPNLFSVNSDEQLKVLADRFQKPGGFDMWSERDGPQLFQTQDELPSARFFPKGIVHSVKPYRRISGSGELEDGENSLGSEAENSGIMGEEQQNGFSSRSSGRKSRGGFGSFSDGESEDSELLTSGSDLDTESSSLKISGGNGKVGKKYNGKLRNKRNRGRFGSVDLNGSGQVGSDGKQRRQSSRYSRGNSSMKLNNSQSEVYDMSLQQDGSYGFQSNNRRNRLNPKTNNTVELERF